MHRALPQWMVLAALAACATPPHTQPTRGTPGRDAVRFYARAKHEWAALHQDPLLSEADRRERRRLVLERLERALDVTPRCALFHSRRGWVLIEQGGADLDAAATSLKEALALTEDWVPAYTGLAWIEIQRGDLDAARLHLANAVAAVSSLQQGPIHDPGVVILGLRVDGPSEPDPMDPSLHPTEGHRLLMSWLVEDLQWRLDDPPSGGQGAGGAAHGLPGAEVLRQLRARIRFVDAALAAAAGADVATVLQVLHEALEFDPNYFDAAWMRGRLLLECGRFREAESVLVGKWDSDSPLATSHPGLRDDIAQLYLSWHLASPADESLLQRAGRFYAAVERRHGRYLEPVELRCGQVYFAARTTDDARAIAIAIATAETEIAAALPSAGADARSIVAELRSQLQACLLASPQAYPRAAGPAARTTAAAGEER